MQRIKSFHLKAESKRRFWCVKGPGGDRIKDYCTMNGVDSENLDLVTKTLNSSMIR